MEKLKLYGFNNLTKSLSFNIYDISYAKSERERRDYVAYVDDQFNSERLTNILTDVVRMIGATVLNISKQDYDPQGASVAILIAEESMLRQRSEGVQSASVAPPVGGSSAAILGHLDKSHVTVHTYPEFHPETSLATFRVDIDVFTCGRITPLSTLDYLIGSFDSDIITIDYRVRGFTRNWDGRKVFMDHRCRSIQDFIAPTILEKYETHDLNIEEANIFQTKMLLKETPLRNYLFNIDEGDLTSEERETIADNLHEEMVEIFSGRNLY